MYIVKFFDFGICYLTLNGASFQHLQLHVFKAAQKNAVRFPTEKAAEKAYKEYYRQANGKALKVPVKSLTSIQILQVEDDKE